MKKNLVGVAITWVLSVTYCLSFSFYGEYSYNTNYVSIVIASAALFSILVALNCAGHFERLSSQKLVVVLFVAYPIVYLGLVIATAYLVVNDNYKMMNSISEARFITFHLAFIVILGFVLSNLVARFSKWRG